MQPLIIGHRGSSGEAPENTLKAFDLAFHQGADGIELDVLLTRDCHVVVTHDEDLERITGVKKYTRECTLSELKALDFGEGEKIPTLEEVFENFGNKFSIINVEIKSTGYFTDGIEKKVIALIQKWKLEEKVVVSSFNPLHLLRMKRLAPKIRRGYLLTPDYQYPLLPCWIRFSKPVSVNLDYKWAYELDLDKYRRLGHQIWLWTVNDRSEMEYWTNKPIDAMITNFPAMLKEIINKKSNER